MKSMQPKASNPEPFLTIYSALVVDNSYRGGNLVNVN